MKKNDEIVELLMKNFVNEIEIHKNKKIVVLINNLGVSTSVEISLITRKVK